MATTVKIEGLRELEDSLSALGKSLGKGVLRRVLKKRAEPVAEKARSLAPDDEATTGARDLKSSIGVSTRLGKRQGKLHRKMFRNDRASVEMHVGAGVLPHAHLQEFGTEHHGPQPFMRPAWDSTKEGVLDGIAADLWTEIEKTAARKARRDAKKAAQG